MEGSRHERAITIAAAYVLGFTAAFILYNNASNSTNLITIAETSNTNLASLIDSQAVVVDRENLVTYVDGRLEVNQPTGKRLLSFNPNISKEDIDFGSVQQGYHYGELKYSLSPDNQFIFLCERQFEEESSCLGFIYEVDTDTFHQVRKQSDLVSISLKSASGASWSSDGRISIGSTISKNSTEPWILIENNY